MHKYVPNFVVKISMMFAKYFEYYTIILRGAFFRGHTVIFTHVFYSKKIKKINVKPIKFNKSIYRPTTIKPQVSSGMCG